MELVRTDLEMRIRITELIPAEKYDAVLQHYNNDLEALKNDLVKAVQQELSDEFDFGNETAVIVIPNSAALCVERICDD